jgi:hypothetical protein
MKRVLLALYPETWRRRYGDELAALLEDDPPGVRGVFDLVRGALTAHLRPLPGSTPDERARTVILGPLACFICFCFVGGTFAKATEDPPFQDAGRLHPVVGAARLAVEVAALGAAACVMVALAPLAWRAVRTARDRGAKELTLPVVAMAGVCVCMAVITAALAVYLVALLSDAPALAATGNGPLTVLDTTTVIGVQLVAMLALSALALLGVRRGLHGLRGA